MKLTVWAALLLGVTCHAQAPPVAPVRPVTDDYFGTKVVDPYRYMENLQDPEVQAWMKAQNDYTRGVLKNIPGRGQILERLRELDKSAPAQVWDVRRLPGDLYFYQKLVVGQDDVAKLYVRHGLTGEEKLVADPEKIKLAPQNQAKGKAAVSFYVPSSGGKFVIVGIVPGGSEDDTELHVTETATGRETGETILRAPLGDIAYPNWLPDDRSFVYDKLEPLPPGAAAASERYDKWRSYLHVLGTDPDKDPAVFGYGVPSINVDRHARSVIIIPPGSHYALGLVDTGPHVNNNYYIADAAAIGRQNIAWRKVAEVADGVHNVAIHGDDLYLLTFRNAPRYKILRTDARKPDLVTAETVVPPSAAVVTGMFAAQDALYVQVLDGGISRLLHVQYGPKPQVQPLDLPFAGAIWGAVPDSRVPGILFTMTGWTSAPKIYAYDSQSTQVGDTKLQPAGPYDDPGNLESVEVKVPSYDGTMVALSIVYAKGLKHDGSNPTHLDGYGAYGKVEAPFFAPFMLALYERNGVYATCHVRGGGEYGEEWHVAGKGPTKPNSWRDFIACAQYLIDQKYTSAAHISAYGGSAGGILIGRAIIARPDLFGAAIIISGVLNALRFEVTGNGPPNFPEFGNTKTEEGFKALYAMDATQHVEKGTAYPAVLLLVGTNDPRVEPWPSGKFAAHLQAASTSGKPVLLRVEYGGGHEGASPGHNEQLEGAAAMISFELWQLGLPGFQPKP